MTQTGRPSDYSEELAARVCERLCDGESLKAICRDPAMPHVSTVFRWLRAHKEFQKSYELAREVQAQILFDELLEIADNTEEGERRKETEDGVEVVTEDMLGHRRLKVDTRKFYLAKVMPKVYGDKVTAELTGKDGGPIETKDVSRTEVARRLALVLRRAAPKEVQT